MTVGDVKVVGLRNWGGFAGAWKKKKKDGRHIPRSKNKKSLTGKKFWRPGKRDEYLLGQWTAWRGLMLKGPSARKEKAPSGGGSKEKGGKTGHRQESK